LLKKAMEGILPNNILKRQKKGFGIPLTQWLRDVPAEIPLAPLGGANCEWASKCWREHRIGAADHRMFLWSWLSMQTVLDRYRTVSPQVAAA
jgi:asparagine synthase (glutamine-hydrolysing)